MRNAFIVKKVPNVIVRILPNIPHTTRILALKMH